MVSLAGHDRRSPDRISDEEVQGYLLHLRDVRHLAPSSLNQHVSALRRFYELALGLPVDRLQRFVPRVRQQTRRPKVFSRAELEKLFTVGCPEIRVVLGKGGKDRQALLPPRLLEELRAYYRAVRPLAGTG